MLALYQTKCYILLVMDIEAYTRELEIDTTWNRITLADRQIRQAQILHKWLYRMYQHKKKIIEKKEELEEFVKEQQEKERQLQQISITKLQHKIAKTDTAIRLKKDIESEQFIVDYLEEAIGILKSMSFDFRGTVEMLKLEMLE